MANRATLQDVANYVGVTKMTVSRYLNKRESVARETADKIKHAIEKLGFVQNRVPAMMSGARSFAVGLVIPSFSNQVFSDVIDGVQDIALKHGYNVLIAHTGYKVEDEQRQIESLLSYKVDGIILTESTHTKRAVKMLSNAHIPVVELMEYKDTPIDMCVGLDHEAISYNVTKGLIEAGRRNIAYLGVRMDNRTVQRATGYKRAMKESSLIVHNIFDQGHSNFTLGGDLLNKALHSIKNLDAIFCTNDDVAVGALISCMDKKIEVPDDLFIVGYNGLNIAKATNPKLCSLDIPRLLMGQKAMQMILDRLDGKKLENSAIKLQAHLTDGASLSQDAIDIISKRLALL